MCSPCLRPIPANIAFLRLPPAGEPARQFVQMFGLAYAMIDRPTMDYRNEIDRDFGSCGTHHFKDEWPVLHEVTDLSVKTNAATDGRAIHKRPASISNRCWAML